MQVVSPGIQLARQSKNLAPPPSRHVQRPAAALASTCREPSRAVCRFAPAVLAAALVERGFHRRKSRPMRLSGRAVRSGTSPMQGCDRCQVVQGVSDIASRYDAFLVDLWGVIHNGKVAFPWAIKTLQKLREMGKPVVFLSNSSRRLQVNTKALERFGITRDLYLDCITSGEETWKALAGKPESSAAKHLPPAVVEAKKLVVFGNGDDDDEFMESLPGCRLVDIAEADLLLARGCFSLGTAGATSRANWDELEGALAAAADFQVPMLVANPDIVRPDGNDSPMPGRLAKRYVQLGGPTPHFVGKPHAAVYEEAYRLLQAEMGSDFSASKVCMVGDSVWHDVQGASRMGIDVLFLCTGIHSQALGLEQAPATPKQASEERLAAFLGALAPDEGPTYVAPAFSWDSDFS